MLLDRIGSSSVVTCGIRCFSASTLNRAARTVAFASSVRRMQASRGCGPPRSVATRAASLAAALVVCAGGTFSIVLNVAALTLQSRFSAEVGGVMGTGSWRILTHPEIPTRKVADTSKGHLRVIAGLIMGTKELLRA